MLSSDRLIYRVDARLRALLYGISPRWLVQYRYLRSTGRWFQAGSPRTLDEKLLWLMLYWRHPLKSRCADRYAVRSYVEELGLGSLLTPLLGVFRSADEIDFDELPDRFVLKTTHASQMNIICADKSRLDVDDARRQLNAWLAMDISWLAGELHYASIPTAHRLRGLSRGCARQAAQRLQDLLLSWPAALHPGVHRPHGCRRELRRLRRGVAPQAAVYEVE